MFYYYDSIVVYSINIVFLFFIIKYVFKLIKLEKELKHYIKK